MDTGRRASRWRDARRLYSQERLYPAGPWPIATENRRGGSRVPLKTFGTADDADVRRCRCAIGRWRGGNHMSSEEDAEHCAEARGGRMLLIEHHFRRPRGFFRLLADRTPSRVINASPRSTAHATRLLRQRSTPGRAPRRTQAHGCIQFTMARWAPTGIGSGLRGVDHALGELVSRFGTRDAHLWAPHDAQVYATPAPRRGPPLSAPTPPPGNLRAKDHRSRPAPLRRPRMYPIFRALSAFSTCRKREP